MTYEHGGRSGGGTKSSDAAGVGETGANASEARGKKEAKDGAGLSFALCALVLAAVVLALPYTRNAARDIARRIAADADIESAIHVLGEGISGERGFLQAIGDAFTVAFHGDDEERGGGTESVSSAPVSPAQPPVTGDADTPVSGETAPDGEAIPDGAALFGGAVTSALAQTRSGYSDMLVPAGAPLGYRP
ncbi:MAG: hypothetical protein LBS51_02895 [Oscillospiraceae bacterium]|jgi:hypothetical protein|nr:hypothetical protein [Oscillospiraceae bacterium]